jgi:outer membrane immunogenic protein
LENEACFSTAFRGSIYVGYSWQVGPSSIVGIESDVGFSNANKTNQGIPGTVGIIVPPALAANDTVNVKHSWDASVRARFGYLMTPNVLVYGTAGPAWQHVEATVTCGTGICGANPILPFSVSNSKSLAGATAGAGVEAGLTRNLIARAEYRYSIYDTFTATYGTRQTLGITSDINMRTHTALIGLAFKFSPPALPPTAPALSIK